MIGVPFDNNDLSCLGTITEVIADLVARRDPLLAELAATYPTTEALAAWIRSLPQCDDEGIPGDGPKVDACEPPQRLRIPAPDPNCVERAALYLGVAELIDPWRSASSRRSISTGVVTRSRSRPGRRSCSIRG